MAASPSTRKAATTNPMPQRIEPCLASSSLSRPSAPSGPYVDEEDGYALVIKSGTNVSKQGIVTFEGDYIKKSVYDDMKAVHVQDGDVLLSSTGDRTLGKCAVYRGKKPAIFDGHVTLFACTRKKFIPNIFAII